MKMKAQPPEPLEYGKRQDQITADYAVRDVYDALVELVTNCDDSYHDMKDKKGQILIEVDHKRKEKSRVIVKDRAEGMTLEEMRKEIKKVGELTSGEGNRGFMGRGAKDCAALGKVTFESIKDNRYHKCEVLSNRNFVPYSPSERATEDIRERLSIPRGKNGMVVTIDVDQNKPIPRHETLLNDLRWHYALRDIMHKDLGRKVLLRNLNEDAPPDWLPYNTPAGEVVIDDEEFEVSGYPGATARLSLYKANTRLEDPPDKRFRRTGILIKGERAIHEVTLFSSEFERDSYAEYYFGRLVCPFIDKLCIEYDCRRDKGMPHPESNPFLIVDPYRKSGLRREHPFTKPLFQFPTERFRALIAKDKQKERQKYIQIADEETRKRLDKLARKASKFMQEKFEELEEIAFTDNETVHKEFTKKGVLIIPDIYTLAIGEIKTFGFRAKKRDGISEKETVKVTCDNDNIRIITPEFPLSASPTSEGILTGSFKMQGIRETDSACVTVSYNGFPSAEAIISVVQSKIEKVEILNGLAFERASYRVKEGKKKRLLLRAEYPSVVADETPVETVCDCQDIVIVRPQARLRPITDANYAEGYVTIQGRKLGVKGKITARVHGRAAQTEVAVIAREETGIPLKIDFTQEDIGSFRAKWDWPDNPNWLLISAAHPSLSRYLGPAPGFRGQSDPHFKLLIAEIVCENIVYKILEEEEKRIPREYEGLSVQGFYARHNRLAREFLPIAHESQLTNQELETIKQK